MTTHEDDVEKTMQHNRQLRFVDQREHIHIEGKKLPHWSQCDCVQFVTFRLADSLPQLKLMEYKKARERWVNAHPKPWTRSEQEEYDDLFGAAIDKWLDAGHGECLLKDKRARDIVASVIMNDDGSRCDIYVVAIMPNHVHILMTPREDYTVQTIVGSWKSLSSHRINGMLNRVGSVWERESFDRMVRDAADFTRYVQYIAANPQHLPAEWFTLMTCL